jgi:tetratricopeptide (TPR) repeat protein
MPTRRSRARTLVALAALAPAAADAQTAAPNATSLTRACEQAGAAPAGEGRARVQAAARAGGAAGAFAEGCLALADERYPEAERAFARAVAGDERNAAYHYFLGRAYGAQAQRANVLRQAGLAGKTKSAFERAVALDPDYVDARLGLMEYYLQAPGLMGGSKAKARAQVAEVRRISPYRGALVAAQVAVREKDVAGASRELDAATRQFPDSTAPYLQLVALQVQQKNPAAAWGTAERLVRARPTAPAAHYVVGRMAAETGDQLDRGAAALTRYLAGARAPEDPPAANAHWRLGAIYERQGKRDLARAEYEAAVRLNPRLTDAAAALARVR